MNYGHLIAAYGYWAVAGFCFLEGETVLLLAGVAAHAGHLKLPYVILVAAAAGWFGDQFFFWLGRRHGKRVLAKMPWIARQTGRLHRLIDRYQQGVIVLVRFAYGLRIAGPILIGTSAIGAATFALYNALGALIWAVLVAGAGWFFGAAVQRYLGTLDRDEAWIFGAAIAIFLVVMAIRRQRGMRSR